MNKNSLSILIPVLNEEANILPLLDEIESVLMPMGRPFEVIIVDDGSTDGSRGLLEKLVDRRSYLKVIFFRKNAGQTAAFDAGFQYATNDYIITMDSDLQNDPHDIPRMIRLLEEDQCDFVTGWRRHRKDRFLLRTLPSLIANSIIRVVTGAKVHDLGCSLKLYRKEFAKELRLYGEMHRFIGVLMTGLGAKVGELEVNHRPRTAGKSKYNLTRTFKVLLDLLTVWFLQGYRTKPSYIFGGIGASLVGGSFLIACTVLFQKFAFGVWVHRNPLFLIFIFCLIVGIQFVAMGLLAELLIRSYFESSNQTPYFISKKIGFHPDVELIKSPVVSMGSSKDATGT